MAVPFFTGLVQGLNESRDQSRAYNFQREEQQRQREQSIFTTLAQSPDADIRASAITGLLMPPPKSKGFFQVPEPHPMIKQLVDLMHTPVATPGTHQEQAPPSQPVESQYLPGQQAQPGGPPPASPAPSGASASQPVVGSGQPVGPQNPQLAMAPPQPTQGPLTPGPTFQAGTTTMQPRNVLMSPMEQQIHMAGATAGITKKAELDAKLEKLKEIYPVGSQEYADAVRQVVAGAPRAPSYMGKPRGQDLPVGTKDYYGRPVDAASYYRRELINGHEQYVPDAPPTALTPKPARATIAGPDGKPIEAEIYPPDAEHPNGRVVPITGASKPVQDKLVPTTDAQGNTGVMRVAPTFSKPGGSAGAAVGTPPTASAAPTSRNGTPRLGDRVGNPPGTLGGPAVIQTGHKPSPTHEVDGFMIDHENEPRAVKALFDPLARKYYDPSNPTQEFKDFIPGKVDPVVVKTMAQTQSTINLIDSALAALKPFKDDNTLAGTMKYSAPYRRGTAGADPVTLAAAQLSDLAGLQSQASAALTAGGSRALRIYTDRRQHVPRLPSSREVQAYEHLPLSAQNVADLSQVLGGEGFDSPATSYQKLLGAKANLQNSNTEMHKSVAGLARREGGSAGLGAAPGAVVPAPPQGIPPEVQGLEPGHTITINGVRWGKAPDGRIGQLP